MAVRWQITFKTLKDRTGLVKVYDSSYSGDPITLTPAVSAFSVSRQQTDFFQPVMTDSGYLRVIDNGLVVEHIEDMHPAGALDRPVEFYLDGTLKWRGYISPESFTMDWEPAPREVAFPLVGVLGVLETVNIEDDNTGVQPIAAFIKECLDATGFTWSGITMLPQMESVSIETTEYDVPELRLSLSRYNFIAPNNSENRDDEDWTPMVGQSYLTILKAICQYFGWVAFQEQDKLVLTTPRVDLTSYLTTLSYAALTAIAADPTAAPSGITVSTLRPTKALSSFGWDGVNHRKSLRNGHKKVILTTNLGYSDNIFPKISYNGKVLTSWDEANPDWSGFTREYYARVQWLDPAYENVILHRYQWDFDESEFNELPWQPPQNLAQLPRPSGAIVQADFWESMTGKINYNYSSYIRLAAAKDLGLAHTNEPLPLMTIIAPQVGIMAKDGALCINFQSVQASYCDNNTAGADDTHGLSAVQNLNGALRMSIKVGDKYYDGDSGTWVSELTINEILCEGGTIHNEKILQEPYNGANGYIMAIDENMTGRIEVTFYPWKDNDATGSAFAPGSAALYLGGMSVGYYNDAEAYRVSEGLRLAAVTNKAFNEDMSVTLAMSSIRDARIGNGILWWNGSPIGNSDIFTYNQSAGGQEASQPEYWLLDSMVKAYTKPSTWLELETEYDDSLSLLSLVSHDSKSFIITTCETDYANEHSKLIIASYE